MEQRVDWLVWNGRVQLPVCTVYHCSWFVDCNLVQYSWEVLGYDVYVSFQTPHPQVPCQDYKLSWNSSTKVVDVGNRCCVVYSKEKWYACPVLGKCFNCKSSHHDFQAVDVAPPLPIGQAISCLLALGRLHPSLSGMHPSLSLNLFPCSAMSSRSTFTYGCPTISVRSCWSSVNQVS